MGCAQEVIYVPEVHFYLTTYHSILLLETMECAWEVIYVKEIHLSHACHFISPSGMLIDLVMVTDRKYAK